MKSKPYLYGLMGLLSLLGFIGVFTDEKRFLVFFVFVLEFEYFFIKFDEMLVEYLNKSASRAFYCGMIATAIVTLVQFFLKSGTGNTALLTGLSFGWAISVVVYALSSAFYGFKEKWGLGNDKE